MYIRLRRKKGKCPACPPEAGEQYLTNGQCEVHYWGALRGQAFKQRAANKHGLITDLEEWYRMQHQRATYVCENCGQQELPLFNQLVVKSHHAHLLPKAQFPSVALHPDNHLMLCGFYTTHSCHARYDACWEGVPALAVYPLVIERFLLFKDKLIPKEVGKLPPFLLEHM